MAEINADAQEIINLLAQKNTELAVENAVLNARLFDAARQIDRLAARPVAVEREPSYAAAPTTAPAAAPPAEEPAA